MYKRQTPLRRLFKVAKWILKAYWDTEVFRLCWHLNPESTILRWGQKWRAASVSCLGIENS